MANRTPEMRLEELGIELPKAAVPVAEYIPCKRVGDIVYVSGQGPTRDGKPLYVGQVGGAVSPSQGHEAARICALNALAAIRSLLGTLDHVEEVVHVRGFVNSAAKFHDQPEVINGVSELLVQVFGESGKHARAALGTSNLPGNIPVEVEMIVRVKR